MKGTASVLQSDKILKYSVEQGTTTILNSVLPRVLTNVPAGVVDTNIYLFGGYSMPTFYNTILRFDTVSETITTLSATLPAGRMPAGLSAKIATNAYVFGDNTNAIIKISNL
jgi:N-acetylneuraminic acid mutarotase